MLTRWKVMALALGIGALLVVGTFRLGVAFAAGTPTPTAVATNHDAFAGRVAAILGVDPTKLENAIVQARNETLDQAVKDGRLTQQQADWMKQHLAQNGAGFGPGYGAGYGPGMMGIGPGYGPGAAGSGFGYGPGMMRGGFGGAGTCPYAGAWGIPPTATPSS